MSRPAAASHIAVRIEPDSPSDETQAAVLSSTARLDLRFCGKSFPKRSGCVHTAFVRLPDDYTMPDGVTRHPRAGLWTDTRMHVAQASEIAKQAGVAPPNHVARACKDIEARPHETHLLQRAPSNWPVPAWLLALPDEAPEGKKAKKKKKAQPVESPV